MSKTHDFTKLFRNGKVHRRLYTDANIFATELERLFARIWLYVAHSSQIPEPGDFVRSRMGRFEVLVTRSEEGSVHVLRNSCAHRGARLCQLERGNQQSFVCPYHAWNYKPDGRLISVPHRQSYGADFDLQDPTNSLQSAPRVSDYRGFIFASWAAQGPSLTEHLGPMTAALDNFVDRAPDGAIEQAGGSFKLEYPGNWKLHMENANDTVHPGFVHASSVASARHNQAITSSALDQGQSQHMLMANGFSEREWQNVELHGFANGHSYMGGFYKSGIISPATDDPVMHRYKEMLIAKLGIKKAQHVLALDRFNNLIYPNLSVNAQYHQIRVVHPLAVDRTLIQTWCFRLKGAPEELFQRAVRFMTTLSSPASMIFSDDVEIFTRCQQGLQQQGIDWLNVERGQASDTTDDNQTWHSAGASELPTRAQFSAWRRYMMEE